MTIQRTNEQEAARQRLFLIEPPGWPNLRCRRHLDFPLVLSVIEEPKPWCGLCLAFLGPDRYKEVPNGDRPRGDS